MVPGGAEDTHRFLCPSPMHIGLAQATTDYLNERHTSMAWPASVPPTRATRPAFTGVDLTDDGKVKGLF